MSDSRGISTYSTINDDTASTLNDIYLYLGKRTFSFDTAIDTELRASTSCALQFGTQKNLQKGDVIAQSCFLDPHYCPIKALVRLVLRHWQYFASKNISFDGSIPLAPFQLENKQLKIKAAAVTDHIRDAACACFDDIGIDLDELTAQSLRVGGAMALLYTNYDNDQIKLLGRQHLDAMMWYLHYEAQPNLQQFAQKIFNSCHYTFLTSNSVPSRYQFGFSHPRYHQHQIMVRTGTKTPEEVDGPRRLWQQP